MTLIKNTIAIGIILIAGSGYCKDKYSAQSAVGVNLKYTDDLTLSARGVAHGGEQIEQASDFYPGTYASSGFTAWEGAVGFEIIAGNVGNLEVSTGGEMLMRTRKLADTIYKTDFHEFSPTFLVGFSLPLGAGAKVDLLNRMERRNFRSPKSPITHLRYVPRMQVTSMELSPFNFSGFCYYEGLSQEYSKHISGWGTGITFYPVKPLRVQGAFTSRWNPALANTVVHQVELNLQYLIDLTN